MIDETQRVAHTREHMSWAYQFSLFWLILALGIFGAAYAITEMSGVAQEIRAVMFIMLGTIIIINAVWQAAALALARLENVILPRSWS
jgi:hypothetical protein